jgi:hypothetical protein
VVAFNLGSGASAYKEVTKRRSKGLTSSTGSCWVTLIDAFWIFSYMRRKPRMIPCIDQVSPKAAGLT